MGSKLFSCEVIFKYCNKKYCKPQHKFLVLQMHNTLKVGVFMSREHWTKSSTLCKRNSTMSHDPMNFAWSYSTFISTLRKTYNLIWPMSLLFLFQTMCNLFGSTWDWCKSTKNASFHFLHIPILVKRVRIEKCAYKWTRINVSRKINKVPIKPSIFNVFSHYISFLVSFWGLDLYWH